MEPEDRLRRGLIGLAPPADPAGMLERVRRRKRSLRLIRRLEVATLVVVVLVGSAGGTLALSRIFGPDERGSAAPAGGERIGFVRTVRACPSHPDEMGPDSELFVIDADGRHEENVSDHAILSENRFRGEQQPDWAPGGARIAWVDRYLDDLFVTDADGGELLRLTRGLGVSNPEWSPNGDLIAFAAVIGDEPPSFGATGIHVVDPSGGEPLALTSDPRFTDWSPTWSPDGTRIAFLRSPLETAVTDGTTTIEVGVTALYVMDHDGSNLELLREAPADVQIVSGEWSPVAFRFVGEAIVNGNHDIYVIDGQNETLQRLTDDPSEDQSPSWSPDGTRIVFSTRVGEQREIAVMNADGSSFVRLTDNCWVDYEPTWIPGPG